MSDLKTELQGIIEEFTNREEDDILKNAGLCSVCGEIEEVREININVFGPHNIKLCEKCELKIIEYIMSISIPKKNKEDKDHLSHSEHFVNEHQISVEESRKELPVVEVIRLKEDQIWNR